MTKYIQPELASGGLANAVPTLQPLAEIYPSSPIKRRGAMKDEFQLRRDILFEIVEAMKPMTVRQVFYQASVRGIVEKSEAGYNKVQTDLVLMRRAGEMPFDWLTDSTRWQRKQLTYRSI